MKRRTGSFRYRDDEAAAAAVVTGIEAAGGTACAVRADAVLWLIGDGAGYCTGSVLDVTGGR